jgi:hypothetical protein
VRLDEVADDLGIRLAREVVARVVLVLLPGLPGVRRLERPEDRVARDPAGRDERAVDVEEDELVAVGVQVFSSQFSVLSLRFSASSSSRTDCRFDRELKSTTDD